MQENKYKVYLLINMANGMYYVGITCQQYSRRSMGGHGYTNCTYLWNAIKKYGFKNFKYFTLKSNLSKENAGQWERFFIKLFQSNNQTYGYNIKEGGFEGKDLSEKGLQHLHDVFYGAGSPRARAVTSFDLNGNFIKEFKCISDASREYNVGHSLISRAVKKHTTTRNMYFRYSDEIDNSKHIIVSGLTPLESSAVNRHKKICQYDSNGNFLKLYSSVKDASNDTGIKSTEISSALSCNLSKKRYTAGGFQWKFYQGNTNNISPVGFEPNMNVKRGKHHYYATEVLQIDPYTDEIIQSFSTITEAAKYISRSNTAIHLALTGKNPTAGGFKWRYSKEHKKEGL